MAEDYVEQSLWLRATGLAVGIMTGSVVGPIFLTPLGLNIAAAASAGAVLGAAFGFLLMAALVTLQKRQRDRELLRAAQAVKAEAKLPETIRMEVKDGQLILSGEVDVYEQRINAEKVLLTIPGVRGITNQIRLRATSMPVAASPDQISRRIQESLMRRAETEGRSIRVELRDSRVILEGTVSSWVEASEAEKTAWNTPGVVEVENRLKVAA